MLRLSSLRLHRFQSPASLPPSFPLRSRIGPLRRRHVLMSHVGERGRDKGLTDGPREWRNNLIKGPGNEEVAAGIAPWNPLPCSGISLRMYAPATRCVQWYACIRCTWSYVYVSIYPCISTPISILPFIHCFKFSISPSTNQFIIHLCINLSIAIHLAIYIPINFSIHPSFYSSIYIQSIFMSSYISCYHLLCI